MQIIQRVLIVLVTILQERARKEGCQYQVTEADVRRIAPKHLADFQAFEQAQVEKAKPVPVKVQLEDRASLEWQFKNTKPCPTCRRAIEKDGGCKWVDCKGCKTEFCYTCLNPGRPGHSHRNDSPCVAPLNDPWAPEKAKLYAPSSSFAIGAIVAVAAILGIYEFYNWFKNKKAKKAPARKQPAARRGVPVRQTRPAARVR
jgi:hypothetical protein